MMQKFMRKIKWLALICITQHAHSVFAQPMDFDKKYVDSITTRLPSYPDDTSKVNKLVLLARMYLTFDPTAAIRYARQGDTIAEKISYREGKIDCLSQSAFCFAYTGEWVKATINANEAIRLCENDHPGKLLFLYNIMVINSFTKEDKEDALNWLQKAIHNPIFLSGNDYTKWATYMQLGMAYVLSGKLDSAVYCANILKQFLKKYPEVLPDLADNSYMLLGTIARKNKDYRGAISYYHLASHNAEALSNAFHEINQADSAIYYALIYLKKGQTSKNNIAIRNASKILAAEYAKSNPAASNKYLQIYIAAQDTLYNAEKIKQLELVNLNEQRNKYELQKKETSDRNKFLLYSLFGILASSVIFSLLVWRNNRYKQRANLKLEAALNHLKTTQAQLIQSEKMASLGELTAGIAHEIQNPLNFVNNFSEVNKELISELVEEVDKGNTNEVKSLANDIRENEEKINHHGKRADAIVKGMLQHSRATSAVKEPTDINKLADEYLRLAYHGLRAKDKTFNATLKTDFDNSIGKVNVIPQDMGRVILNLITNAFYAVAEKKKQLPERYEPTVSVSTKRINGKVEISVRDNGNGMPQKVVDKIFQPFFTTKPTGQGTGLGLSMSYDIVKAHSGEIKVETKEGEGSEFIIQLPVS
jgi:two-component system, NtrC family, sensor kinase